MRHLFTKELRLLKSREFGQLRTVGTSYSGRACRFQYFIPHSERIGSGKMGITVTKKFGNAVKRNEFKRWVRESFRQQVGNFPLGVRINVAPLFWTKEMNYQTIYRDFETLSLELVKRFPHGPTQS